MEVMKTQRFCTPAQTAFLPLKTLSFPYRIAKIVSRIGKYLLTNRNIYGKIETDKGDTPKGIRKGSNNMKYTETRILDSTKLRQICIENDWYTRGTNEEYANLFSKLHDEAGCPENMTTEKLAEIAQDIMEHSEISDYTITSVMYVLARGCYTYFDIA